MMGEIANDIINGPTFDDLDDLEQATNRRIFRNAENEPECTNCGSTNIKTSQTGNLYCADLCWVDKDET